MDPFNFLFVGAPGLPFSLVPVGLTLGTLLPLCFFSEDGRGNLLCCPGGKPPYVPGTGLVYPDSRFYCGVFVPFICYFAIPAWIVFLIIYWIRVDDFRRELKDRES